MHSKIMLTDNISMPKRRLLLNTRLCGDEQINHVLQCQSCTLLTKCALNDIKSLSGERERERERERV